MPAPQERPELLFALGLGAAVLSLLLFAWLAQQVAGGATIAFDAGVRAFVHQKASPGLTSLMRFMSALGAPGSLLLIGTAAVLAFRRLQWNRAAVRFLITVAGGLLLDATLKIAFHRTRPVSFFGTPEPQSYSFPSGHAMFSVCFFGALAALITARVRDPAARAAIWTVTVALATLIGLSRIYLGVHYPSDVLAGYAAAVVWVGTVAWADRMLLKRRSRNLAARET